jgi:hypothetical protein
MKNHSRFQLLFTVLAVGLGWLLLATRVAVQAQFAYTTDNGTIRITGYTGTDADVVIPSTIDGLPVTSIETNALTHSSLTSVTIPNSVTSIGDSAFSYCSSLTAITVDSANQNYSRWRSRKLTHLCSFKRDLSLETISLSK